jgi:hypothetical protein
VEKTKVTALRAAAERQYRCQPSETHREPQAVLVELVGEALEREGKLAALRSAIDEGDASGIAEDGVFERVRERAGLPTR